MKLVVILTAIVTLISCKEPTIPGVFEGEFSFPVVGGEAYQSDGMKWCSCVGRGVGTHPHVGSDMSIYQSNNEARAMRDGVVTLVFEDGCNGNFVQFKDKGGILWQYVHLSESPLPKQGQEIARGGLIGKLGKYPLSGCGTGAHLHLERKSAGDIPSKCAYRKCPGDVWKKCNFDPASIFGIMRTNEIMREQEKKEKYGEIKWVDQC